MHHLVLILYNLINTNQHPSVKPTMHHHGTVVKNTNSIVQKVRTSTPTPHTSSTTCWLAPATSATLDLTSSAIEAGLCLLCKSSEAAHLGVKGCVVKVRIHPQRLDVCAPVLPICCPDLDSRLQLSRVKCVVHKVEFTCITTSQLRWKTVHKF